MYKLLPSSVIWTPRSTSQTRQQKKFQNQTIEIINDLNSTVNCQSQEREETTRPVENVALTMKALQERKHNFVSGTTVGKICNKNK